MNTLASLLGNRCSISGSWVSPKCSTSYSLRALVRRSATRHCLISYSSCSQTSYRVPLTAVQWDTNSQNNSWRNDIVGSQKFCFVCLGTYWNIRRKSLIWNINVFTLDSVEKLTCNAQISGIMNFVNIHEMFHHENQIYLTAFLKWSYENTFKETKKNAISTPTNFSLITKSRRTN